MKSVLPFDELNSFKEQLRERFVLVNGRSLQKEEEEDIIDEMLDLFLLAYATGNEVTNASLSSNWKPSLDEVMKVVDKKVAGKNWRDRAEEHFTKARNGEIPILSDRDAKSEEDSTTARSQGSTERADSGTGETNLLDSIIRIAETETHRDSNEAALETAINGGATTKTWLTMADDRVRDTHIYLENVTVGIDEDFYTYDGDHAPAPGLFSLPENNINCRCELMYGRE